VGGDRYEAEIEEQDRRQKHHVIVTPAAIAALHSSMLALCEAGMRHCSLTRGGPTIGCCRWR